MNQPADALTPTTTTSDPPRSGGAGWRWIKITLVVLAILAWASAPTWNAYRWPTAKRAWLAKGNWTVVHEGKGGEVVYPWTWVYPYTNSILAVDLTQVRRHEASGYLIAPVMGFVRGDGSEASDTFLLCAFDPKQKRMADLISTSLSKLEEVLAMPPLPDDFMDHAKWRDASGPGWGNVMSAVESRSSESP